MPDVMILREWLLTASGAAVCLLLFVSLMMAGLGRRFTDRIIAVNVIGTRLIVLFAVMAVIVGGDYLADICLVCAGISFLLSVVLSRLADRTDEAEEGFGE